MATKATIQVQGLRELLTALQAASQGQRLDREMLKAGQDWAKGSLVKRMASRAPRRSGRLAGSVRATRSAKAVGIAIGTNVRVPYAGPINFGWPARNIRAQEFIYSTIAKQDKEWEQSYVKAMDEWLRRAFPEGRL